MDRETRSLVRVSPDWPTYGARVIAICARGEQSTRNRCIRVRRLFQRYGASKWLRPASQQRRRWFTSLTLLSGRLIGGSLPSSALCLHPASVLARQASGIGAESAASGGKRDRSHAWRRREASNFASPFPVPERSAYSFPVPIREITRVSPRCAPQHRKAARGLDGEETRKGGKGGDRGRTSEIE